MQCEKESSPRHPKRDMGRSQELETLLDFIPKTTGSLWEALGYDNVDGGHSNSAGERVAGERGTMSTKGNKT